MTYKNRIMDKKNNQGSSSEQAGYDPTRAGGKDYKNIETSVNNPAYFDDDDANMREDEMASEDARTEDEGETGKN
jgi:hypothetical protein